MFSRTLRPANGCTIWNVRAMPLAARTCVGRCVIAVPSNWTSPLVGASKLIFTSGQLGFGYEEKDVRLAFDRMKKALESVQGSMKRVAFSSLFPLTAGVTAKIRAVRSDYYNADNPPASTMLLFEGLPSMDASFSIDLIAVR